MRKVHIQSNKEKCSFKLPFTILLFFSLSTVSCNNIDNDASNYCQCYSVVQNTNSLNISNKEGECADLLLKLNERYKNNLSEFLVLVDKKCKKMQ